VKRVPALWSWIVVGLGVAVALAAVAAPSNNVRDLLFLVAAVQIVPALLVARHMNDASWRVVAFFGVVAACTAGSHFAANGDPAFRSVVAVVLALGAAGCTAAALLIVFGRSWSRGAQAVIGDALIVALGSWIVGWAVLVQPIRAAHGGHSVGTMLFGLHQPAVSVVVFLVALMLIGFRDRPRAVWCITGALALNTIGNLLYALIDAGHLGTGAVRLALPCLIAAFFAASAAFVDPAFAAFVLPHEQPHARPTARLAATTASLVFPIIVLAGTSPDDTTDRVVRTVSALLLAGVVTLRVILAVRANNAAQAELLHGAQTDPLTGLPNRTVLLERINELLRNSWGQEQHPTIYFVDLDRFKNINDSLGHAAGDEVLVTVARRLVNAVPDGTTVARLSGDEYVVLDASAKSAGAAMAVAERLLAVFREPLALSQGDVFVTASIGVASISATSSTSPEDLVRHADTAMYRAKDAGRNCLAVYDESMHERVAHRLAVETALYRALDRRELRLFHQPILDLQSGDVVGFEALMRWQQADGTIVSPAEFIPIAEDTGTIVPIGSWALLEALSQLRRWIDDGVCSPAATMSVNVSPRQLSDTNFPAIVSEALTRAGVSPQLLWLEVTESIMISEPELALATLRRLRSLGVRVALDDFGTGYSSLSLLQKFPLQRIKIDRAFVHGVADNPNDRSLVRTIIAMGRSLGLDMVAEGVESVHQLQVLSDLGCSKAQGFLISHPVPADAMRSTVAALERLGQFPGLRTNTTTPVN